MSDRKGLATNSQKSIVLGPWTSEEAADQDIQRNDQQAKFDRWVDALAIMGGYQPKTRQRRCQTGDVWLLGSHRLMCGDSTKKADIDRLMGGQRAALCFTSPPYLDQRTYMDGNRLADRVQNPLHLTNAPPDDFDALMFGVSDALPMLDDGQVLVNFGQVITAGEIVPYFDAWRAYMRHIGFKHRDTYVWNKMAGKPFVVARLMRSHEEIFHFCKKHRHPNKTVPKKATSICAGTVKYTRRADGSMRPVAANPESSMQTHRQDYSVLNVSSQAGEDRARRKLHPAVFPLELCRKIIPIWTNEGDVVFDPFCGSGTMILASEELGRKCYGMELLPNYCDVAIAEWERNTGKKAVKLH
jgi:DNA modification methylase